MTAPSFRLRVTLAALALVLPATVAVIALPAAPASARVSTSHPFSEPLYLPLHTSFGVDCIRTNPGCDHDRGFWSMDISPTGQAGPNGKPSHARVYAMGAGYVHYGNAHGARCPATHGGFGTWVWINHGGGTVSRYGHLSRILVRPGTHVAAGQAIGVVGTTGKGGKCDWNYLDFMVEHRGLSNRHSVQFKTLRSCVGSGTSYAVWPRAARSTFRDAPVRYTTWNDVRKGTMFPASNSNCIPSPRHSPASPGATRVSHAGHGRLTVHWARPAAADHVSGAMIELSLYHPSTRAWDKLQRERYVSMSARATAHTFANLSPRRTYRIRVSFHNATGWSRAAPWRLRKVT